MIESNLTAHQIIDVQSAPTHHHQTLSLQEKK